MDGLEDNPIINYYESEIEIHQKGSFLGGYIKLGEFGRYFYRENQRYNEVFAAHFGKKYGIAMDANILHSILEENADYIFIKTQYNIYQISTQHFINNMIGHHGLDGIYLCSEEEFIIKEIEDDLDDKKDNKDNDNDNNEDKKLNRSGKYKTDSDIRKKADEIHKKAKENSDKARKEDPIGDRSSPEEDDYKEGEQISMF